MTFQPEPQIPDPNGPPQVSRRTRKIVERAISLSLKIVVGGTAALVVLACLPTRTMGALRS